jgi:tripartite-type tricarboxylate transporter receptor subunit TctC
MGLPRRRFLGLAAAAAAFPAMAPTARAQAYPTRTVRIIVPFGPASGTDIAGRLFADRLAARWGKPVVVENRPGGDGLVAISAFVGANDDHALLLVPAGTFAVHPYEHDKLPYDAERDLLPIAGLAVIVLALTVSGSLGVGSLDELVALARANPGKLNAAAANGNSDFLLSGFLKGADLQIAKVPYRDIMQAPNDLGEGRIQVLTSSLVIVQAAMQAGRVKVLAVTSRERAPTAPDVPTVAEAGYPALELQSLMGLFGPRGMSMAQRERIAADLREVAAADPLIATRLAATGQILKISGPAEFGDGVEELRSKLAAIAKAVGIKAVGMKPAQ